MSKQEAEKFFDNLEKDAKLQVTIRRGPEKLAKNAGYEATEDELTAELTKHWKCKFPAHPPYSEPPGFRRSGQLGPHGVTSGPCIFNRRLWRRYVEERSEEVL